MGLDMKMQAFPSGEQWLNVALENDAVRDSMSSLPSYLVWGRFDPEDEEMKRFVGELLAAFPGIEKRNCYVDRFWDTFAYLLSDLRREMPPGWEEDCMTDTGIIASRGEQMVFWEDEEVCGEQGIPIGMNSAPTVARVADYLDSVSDDTLRAVFDPEAMEQADVYKAPSGTDEWDEIISIFHKMKQLYRDAATHGEMVLLCVD